MKEKRKAAASADRGNNIFAAAFFSSAPDQAGPTGRGTKKAKEELPLVQYAGHKHPAGSGDIDRVDVSSLTPLQVRHMHIIISPQCFLLGKC
jgi:hypothetical protein